MGKYERKDRFYIKAKASGRASRASYKLEQIEQKYKVIKRGDRIVDLGASPGGWLEVASKMVGDKGKIFGIDLLPLKIREYPNVSFIQTDVCGSEIVGVIKEELGEVDVVMSDMAPSTSGIKFKDSYLSYELALSALNIAKRVLNVGGNFIVKIFPGDEFQNFKNELVQHFEKVSQYRPEATRKTSIEVYLVGIGYKGL